MRNSLRNMIDSGFLAAAAVAPAPIAKKPKPPAGGEDGAAPMKKPMAGPQQANPAATVPMGPQEMHIHLHAPMAPTDPTMDPSNPMGVGGDPSDDDQDVNDPSETDQDPSDDEQEEDQDQSATDGSPMAQQIAQTHMDPLGATKKVFGKLTKTSLAYKQAQEEAKRTVIPSLAVLKHVSDAHQLQPAMPAMDPNNPDTQGIDPNTGQPMNMNQQPGMGVNQGPPGFPGQGTGNGPLRPGTANPGSATQGAQTQVRPPKAGMPKPGQSKGATKAGNPSGGNKQPQGKGIKLEIRSAVDTRCQNRGRRQIEAAASIANLRFQK